ncbi:hypothetical protein J2S02_001347 [Metabacillus niabensis]|uniref:Z-ring formation inhibitor MciZ n=1 Tax=Metabacillus niabensis TaxID=324854 RepID=A0ABT9Z0D1_9BACI|nr:Z-ring formation inhibitor MciZ [Metabacillus niabensis]MDQ0225018.1 hypothetical protein [Metabacillus niabensis]
MKIYRMEDRIILTGKAWEIRAKLKEYSEVYSRVQEWIQDEKSVKSTFTPKLYK